MTKEQARKKWIAALRSGKYTQGHFALHEDNAFCCLGVACDLFKDELELEVERIGPYMYYDQMDITVPTKLQKYLGLFDGHGPSRSGKVNLANLNDTERLTFDEIADALETGEYWDD